MGKITLAQADAVIDGALAKGGTMGAKPLTVAVLDDGGHLVALKRQDNSAILRPEVAFGKAWGALSLGTSSRAMEERAAERPMFVASVIAASGGRVVTAPGGVLILDSDGAVAGAVGISGDTSELDEDCAIAGIEAAALRAG